jgi:phosphoglucomutase
VVPPHDKAIVTEVNAVPLNEVGGYLEKSLAGVTVLGTNADEAYLAAAAKAAIDPSLFQRTPAERGLHQHSWHGGRLLAAVAAARGG